MAANSEGEDPKPYILKSDYLGVFCCRMAMRE